MLQANIIILAVILQVTFGWNLPGRCNGVGRLQLPIAETKTASVTTNITEAALKQNEELNEKYRDAKFYSVPISGRFDGIINVFMYAPNDCKFHTYAPHLLASVSCQEGVTCKLARTVTTTKSYTASEGYNWGVKISAKASFLDKMFEVGGEVSSGGTYTCSFTESKSTADTVDCSVGSNNNGKTLQLYNVQSDMDCQFSTVTLNPDTRSNSQGYNHHAFLTKEEVEQIQSHAIVRGTFYFMPNLYKISNQLFEKLKYKFPLWNPFTDLILITSQLHGVAYFKEVSSEPGPRRVIPFTNENGDSVYQYACRLD